MSRDLRSDFRFLVHHSLFDEELHLHEYTAEFSGKKLVLNELDEKHNKSVIDYRCLVRITCLR